MSQLPLTFYRCEHLGRSWFSGNPYRPTPQPPIECVVSVSLEGLSQVDSCACGTLGDAVGVVELQLRPFLMLRDCSARQSGELQQQQQLRESNIRGNIQVGGLKLKKLIQQRANRIVFSWVITMPATEGKVT